MKTKVVYVLTCSEEDLYLYQTFLSIFSLRRREKNVFVEMVVDRNTSNIITGKSTELLKYIDNLVIVDVPNQYSRVQSSRYIKTSLREIIKGDYLFLDSDTIIADNISEIDNFVDDICMVLDVHTNLDFSEKRASKVLKILSSSDIKETDNIPYYNSGVIYVKDTPLAHQFYTQWHELWKETLIQFHFHQDQPSLAVTNLRMSFPVKELNGIWNCQVMNSGLPFLHQAKIIHYFATANQLEVSRNADKAYVFNDMTMFEEIRQKGFIPESFIDLVDNARGAFVTPCRIVVGNNLALYQNSLYVTAMKYPQTYVFLNSIARIMNRIYRFLK